MAFLRLGRGGGGGGVAAPSAAAADTVDAINVVASTAVASGFTVWGEDKMWQSNKATTTPSPATDANYLASPDWVEVTEGYAENPEYYLSTGILSGAVPAGAKIGYQIVDGGIAETFYNNGGVWAPAVEAISVSPLWSGKFTTNQTITAADFTADTYKGSFVTTGGALEATINSGIPVGSEVTVFMSGGNSLTVRSTAPETIVGVAGTEGATLNISGSALFKKVGTDWQLFFIAPSSPASPQSKAIIVGGYFYSQASGEWWNNTTALITIGNDESATALTALGLTSVKGMTA